MRVKLFSAILAHRAAQPAVSFGIYEDLSHGQLKKNGSAEKQGDYNNSPLLNRF